jgi:sulfide:quinone oxidoreductase
MATNPTPNLTRASTAVLSRRQWLLGSAGAAVLAGATHAAHAAKTKTQAHIMILGSGLGGIAVGNPIHA